MTGRNRNKPCWCGSGLKFKNCHLSRQEQERPKLWEARQSIAKSAETKLCLHPNASSTNCDKQIVRAHTVRRSADLKAIAENGHVYQTSADLIEIDRNSGKLVPKLIGINKASTFRGFCSKHDSATFAPIETASLTPTEEQSFLLAYRPLCKELYAKERQLESMTIIRQADKGRPLSQQLEVQEFAFLMETGIETALRDLREHKTQYDDDLRNNSWKNMRFVAIELDRTPDIMCSSVLQPEYTFSGKRIQDFGDLTTPLECLSLTVAATPSGGAIIFAWRSSSDPASSELVDSLLQQDVAHIPNAVARYIFSNIENSFFRPTWWDGLSHETQASAVKRLHQNVGPDNQVEPDYLANDGERYVNWGVSGIQQKRS